jgi:hypothetical protein
MRGLSGIRAGLLGAAGGGALVTALAMAAPTPSTPAMAAPASCSPTANGQGGSGTATAATGTQTCTGGDTGLAYTATGGNLTVNLNNDAINGFAVNINDDGGARNITVNDGLASASYAAASILSSDSSNNAVKILSSGGNVAFSSLAGGTVNYTGSGTTGGAINLQTTGSGTVTIITGDAVASTNDSGILGQSVNGAVSITANGSVGVA